MVGPAQILILVHVMWDGLEGSVKQASSVESANIIVYLTPHSFNLYTMQPSAPVPVKLEGPAQLLTLAPVMWGGLECSVKHVGERLIYCLYSCNVHTSVCLVRVLTS